MGAGNILPTIPFFGDESVPSLDDLNALSYAVSFVSDCDMRPTWKVYTVNNQAVASGSWNTLTLETVAYDSDGVADGTGATIVTQGIYSLAGCIQVEDTGSVLAFGADIFLLAGGNNPHFSGTKIFSFRGGEAESAVSTSDSAMVTSTLTPFALYPGDKIRLKCSVSAATTLRHNNNPNYAAGRFVPSLCGTWVREGS